MTRVHEVKTTFTAGQISRDLLGRGDLKAYENGALTLKNVFIKPTGGVTRRFGMGYVDTARGDGRLVAFEFSTEQTALLVFTHGKIDIYTGGLHSAVIDAPWTASQVPQIVWTQSADTLLLTHPDVPPKKLVRSGAGVWSLIEWNYFSNGNVIRQPYFKFAESAVTLTPSGLSGVITITASAPVFAEGHENTRIRIGNKEVVITDYDSPTVVSGNVVQTLGSVAATIDWMEQAFSPVRGYPVSAAFHQDRLVIGGSRDLPNRLWFSKSGDLFNFDLGTGLDDEAIEFSILSDQVNAIRGLFSGRHLQVFTSGAEWMVTGEPLTPAAVQIRRQTRIGSRSDRYIPPVNVDGATLYAARSGKEIHEYLYTDVEQAYASNDLAYLARDVLGRPIDQDYDQRNRLLYVVRDDGKFATLTQFRAEMVSAWTLHETLGNARSVSVVGDEVYLLIQRGGEYYIEVMDENLQMDSALSGDVIAPVSVWTGLDHLNGKTASIMADGSVLPDMAIHAGQVNLDEPVRSIQIGLAFTHVIEPMPLSQVGVASGAQSARMVRAVFRVQDTAGLRVDVGRGLRDVGMMRFGGQVLDDPAARVSGDIEVRALGWSRDGSKGLWRIEQNAPLPFTLLSVRTELKLND